MEEFSLPKEEEKIEKFWNERRIFEKSLEKTKKGKPFTFYDGPPFATGLPHYGHILASTIKDVIPRYQTMRGRFVRRRWGWDCHGLPIEEIVERKLGISGKKDIEEKIGIAKFNQTCRNTVLMYVAEWKKMVERIARWVDFDNSYKTMDRDYMESVWWAFSQAYKKGLVYEGRKVLLYCPRCETPVSNFEVAMDNSYQEVTEEAVTVRFRIKRSSPEWTNTSLLAWTTTPWTLPGNVALAVNSEHSFVCLPDPYEADHWIILEEEAYKRLAASGVLPDAKKLPKNEFDIFSGNELIGLEYEPLFEVPAVKSDKAFKVYDANFVSTEEGTGIVHTAVVYGEDDYKLGQKVGLPVVPLLDEKGKFNDKAPNFLRGVYFKKANKLVIDNLEARKPASLIFQTKEYTHSYPHCWRCGNELFYNALPAWFINIQKIKKKLLDSNKREVNWFPAHLKHGRYQKSVEQAPDWNISRNRYWGNPIPVWKCKKCGKVEVISDLDELSKKAGKPKNEYWIMRHGEAENNAKDIIDSGQQNFHLTAHGKDLVKQTGKTLRGAGIDLIISSDILRTKETADLITPLLGVKNVLFDKRLREIKLGALSGKHTDEYHKRFRTYQEKLENTPEGGESLKELRARLWNFLSETEKKYHGKKILLVSHDYPLWMLSSAALGWTDKQTALQERRRGKTFVKYAEAEKLDLEILPRDETGEVDLHRPYIDEIVLQCGKCGGESRRTSEIFDSWTEAGSMPFAEYHYPFENKEYFPDASNQRGSGSRPRSASGESRFPAQFVSEYIAQTRAWFYVMHVIGVIIFGKAPFENVVTTGTILAEDGSKMSKSRNNFPDPWDVINKYGADALRFYLMNSVVMQADNLNFSVKDLENVYRKVNLILWNVHNYYKTYIAVEPWAKRPKSDPRKAILDKWIARRTHELVAGVTANLDNYDTVKATRAIQEYVDDLSTWYVRRSRGRNDKAFFETLGASLKTTSQVIAPFMPHLAEMIYLGLKKEKSLPALPCRLPAGRQAARQGDPESVHLADWPKIKRQATSDKRQELELIKAMAEVRQIASLGLAKRAEAGIKVRQPLAELGIKNQEARSKLGRELLEILKDEVNVKEVKFDSKLSDEVELDTTITPRLKEEGLMRELKRSVQELRQKANLKPGQLVTVMLDLPKEFSSAVLRNEKSFKKDVSAKAISYGRSEKFDAEFDTKIDGVSAWIGIRKFH